MVLVRYLFFAVLALAPLTLVPSLQWIEYALQALGIACILILAAKAPKRELDQVANAAQVWLLTGLAPIALIFIQLMPMPFAWAHPIWTSAASAVDLSWGHLTVDTHATLQSLMASLSAIALFVTAAIISVDRVRANFLLVVLNIVAASVTVVMLARQMHSEAEIRIGLSASIGTMLSAGLLVRANILRREFPDDLNGPLKLFGIAVVNLLICAAALLSGPNAKPPLLAVLGGVICLSTTIVIRRWFFGRWSKFAIWATMAAIGAAYFGMVQRSGSGPLVGPSSADALSVLITGRILNDVDWTGIGAGTFSAMATVYQAFGEPAVSSASTGIAGLVIEFGRPAAVAIVLAALFIAQLMLQRAVLRKRDYVYPALAGSSLVCLLLLAISSPLTLSENYTLIAPVLGLGAAQSVSSRIQA